MNDKKLEKELLNSWEEVYKKGQLTLWILLSLKDGPKHMSEIRQFILQETNGTLVPEDQSLYRSLRRYAHAEMIDYTEQPSSAGPDKKSYHLTSVGGRVLEKFIRRNVEEVYYAPRIRKLIEKKIGESL